MLRCSSYNWREKRKLILIFSMILLWMNKVVWCMFFWADAMSRKNYSHFSDAVSFDSTYSTNQYNMIFAPFYWSQSSFAKYIYWWCILSKWESWIIWMVVQDVPSCDGRGSTSLIITDEAASMRSAIAPLLRCWVKSFCLFALFLCALFRCSL